METVEERFIKKYKTYYNCGDITKLLTRIPEISCYNSNFYFGPIRENSIITSS